MIQKNKLKLLAFVFIVAIFVSYQVGYVFGTGSMSSTTIEAGSMVSGYSYIIFKEGSTYYVKNGSTGAIDYSGTNALTITRTVFSVLSGGNVLLKEGIYEMSIDSNMIEIGAYETLEGVGDATIIKVIGKVGGSGGSINGQYARLITLVGAGATIRHLKIDGNSAGLTWRNDYTVYSSFSIIVTGITNLDTYVPATGARIEDITLYDIHPDVASKALGLYGIGINLFYSPYAVVQDIRVQDCDQGVFVGVGVSAWVSEYSISKVRSWDGVGDKLALYLEEGTVNVFDIRCIDSDIFMPAGGDGISNSTFSDITIKRGSWNGGGSGNIIRCTFVNVIVTDYYPPDNWGLNLDQLVWCMFANIIIYPDPVGGIHLIGTYNATNCNWLP